MITPEPGEPRSIFNTTNYSLPSYDSENQYIALNDTYVVNKDWVAALEQDEKGVVVYLSGVAGYIGIDGADIADIVEKLR